MKLVALLLVVLSAALGGACGTRGSGPELDPIVAAVPFADGETLTYAIYGEQDRLNGRGVLTVRRDGANLRLEQRYEEASPPAGSEPNTDVAVVVVDADGLQPRSVERRVKGRDASDTYWATYADGSVSIVEDGSEPRSVQLPSTVYDNESSLWLWRALSLSEGYEERYVSMDVVNRARQAAEVSVTGRQTVEVPAGRFETWRLQVRKGRATGVAWIEVEAPHRVVQWDNGAQVFRLEAR